MHARTCSCIHTHFNIFINNCTYMCRLDHALTYSFFVSLSLSLCYTHAHAHTCLRTYTLSHIGLYTIIYIYIYGLTRSCTLILCDTHTLIHTRIHIHLSTTQHTHAYAIDYNTLLFQQKIVSNRKYEICILHLNLCHKSQIRKEFFFVIYRNDL